MGTLVLLRHGQSQWNLENRFAGWSDIPLTDRGRSDARVTAGFLKDFTFDRAFTSRLERASETLSILLSSLGQEHISVMQDAMLNERHYGDLQGLNRAETAVKFGQEQVLLWRRSFATPPPNGESIEDCVRRVPRFFRQYILPHVALGETVLVAAHGNSLRPILMELDHLDGDATAALEIPLCTPIVYMFDGSICISKRIIDVPGIVTTGGSVTSATVPT